MTKLKVTNLFLKQGAEEERILKEESNQQIWAVSKIVL